MSETKYYHAQNASRVIAGIVFQIYEIFGGSPFGVYQTQDGDLIKKLDAVVADKKSAVTLITADEYEALLKKKPSRLENFKPSTILLPEPAKSAVIKGEGAVVVDKPVEPTVEVKTVLDKPEDAVVVQQVVEPVKDESSQLKTKAAKAVKS